MIKVIETNTINLDGYKIVCERLKYNDGQKDRFLLSCKEIGLIVCNEDYIKAIGQAKITIDCLNEMNKRRKVS